MLQHNSTRLYHHYHHRCLIIWFTFRGMQIQRLAGEVITKFKTVQGVLEVNFCKHCYSLVIVVFCCLG